MTRFSFRSVCQSEYGEARTLLRVDKVALGCDVLAVDERVTRGACTEARWTVMKGLCRAVGESVVVKHVPLVLRRM